MSFVRTYTKINRWIIAPNFIQIQLIIAPNNYFL
jgi:hypothetical protein